MNSRDLQAYHAELTRMAERLRQVADQIEIIGDDAARFVLATTGPRSLEVYQGRGGVCIEPWRDERNLGEAVVASYDEALDLAIRWLVQSAA